MENFGRENIKGKNREDLEKEIGFCLREIKDFSEKSKREWLDNFLKNLSEIKKIIETEESASFFSASALESALLKINILEININNIRKDLSESDWLQVRELLLDNLDKLMN